MNKLPLLNPKVASKSSKGKENIKLVKADCRLFSNLYIASQSRAGDLVKIFLAMKIMLFQYRFQNMANFVRAQSPIFLIAWNLLTNQHTTNPK